LLRLCQKFVHDNDLQAGEEAARYLDLQQAQLSSDAAQECLNILLDDQSTTKLAPRDAIIARLLQRSREARASLASRLRTGPVAKVFDELYRVGDHTVNSLIAVVLDESAWASEPNREKYEQNVFKLLLAKLVEVGHDHDARAIAGVARLLATDAQQLESLIDTETFDVMLSLLDIRLSANVRSQATLAIAKYLEISQEKGQTLFSEFVTSRVVRETKNDLILAFSVAAAVFPILPPVAASLFLTEGFVQSLALLLGKDTKGGEVELAALELLSAACIDGDCREAIRSHCSEWLETIFRKGDDHRQVLAALILAKVRAVNSNSKAQKPLESQNLDEGEELVNRFTNMMERSDEISVQSSIEGLAFTSLRPKVKEKLAKDKVFLKSLSTVLSKESSSSTLIFGGLTILVNLTRFQPILSEEQKRISQLKAYANSLKTSSLLPDPLDDEAHITERCTAVVEAGVIPVLVTCAKKVSSTALPLILDTLLALSKVPKCRGKIAQQGGLRLLLTTYSSVTGTTPSDIRARRTAAHALARILISVNPMLVFSSSGQPQNTSAIRPLFSLLSLSEEESVSNGPRDLLPTFESLLALTNLASTPDATVADTIIRLAWPTIEELLLSNKTPIQRASVELVCNLMLSPSGVAKFADGTPRAGQRMHILLALADVEDFATRRAAGGALAMLTEYDGAVLAILDRERGVEILLGLCGEDEEEEIVHRGVVCLRNVICASGEVGARGRKKVKEQDGVHVLKEALKRSSNQEILQMRVEALKELIK